MKKVRNILALGLAFVLTVAGTVGVTIAWLQDDDSATNTFTVGNVAIELVENFEQNSKLLPSTGSAQDGTLENGITKEVTVKNVGSENAYIRVHIAIPTVLDNGTPEFNAGKNTLHFNYKPDSVGAGKWDWSKAYDDGKYEGDWNFYTTTIDNVGYNVYVVTYTSEVASQVEISDYAMHQVYLDSKVTNEDLAGLDEKLGGTDSNKFDGKWDIEVVAEGVQAAGFDNAYDALNTAFGTPGSYDPFNQQ